MLERLFIFRYLLGQTKGSVVRVIAFISALGIALGAMAMVVVLSVMNGFDESIKKRLLTVESHLIVPESTGIESQKIRSLVKDRGTVDFYAKQDVIIRTLDGLFSGAMAQGFEENSLRRIGKRVRQAVEVTETPQGSISSTKSKLTRIDFHLSDREVAVGVDLARGLGVYEGDDVTLVAPESLLLPAGEPPIYEKVKVKALVRTDLPDVDSHVLFYNVRGGLKKLQDSASLERGYEVRLQDPYEADSLAAKFKAAGFKNIQTWGQRNSALLYSLKMEKALMALFLALTVLVSSFSVLAVLILLVTEKRKDVGILKAIGATKNKVRRIFVSIGFFLGFLGIGGGTSVGLLVCWLLVKYPFIRLPNIYYDTSFPVKVETSVIVGIIGFGGVLAFLGALVPAWQVSQCEPVDSIRSDDA